MAKNFTALGADFNSEAMRLRVIAKGIRQVNLARDLGVSDSKMWAWMNGKYKPDYQMIKRIARVLECDVADLLRPPVIR